MAWHAGLVLLARSAASVEYRLADAFENACRGGACPAGNLAGCLRLHARGARRTSGPAHGSGVHGARHVLRIQPLQRRWHAGGWDGRDKPPAVSEISEVRLW